MKFNINDKVRVRLTDYGRQCHKTNHDAPFQVYRHRNPFPYNPPIEDSEGWSEWQLWELMQAFGQHIGMGMRPPFETIIELVAGDLQPTSDQLQTEADTAL